MLKSRLIISLFSLVLSCTAQAAEKKDDDHSGNYKPFKVVPKPNDCERFLSDFDGDKSHRFIFSGRDDDIAPQIEKYANEVYGPGGIAEKLGLSSTHQVIQFLPGSELNAIAANGRMPVGHWMEGARILNASRGGSGILEMVISGGMIRHSIYRDDLNWKQQLSIINHVLGHVHFGVHSVFAQSRTIETNQAAYEFDAMLEDYKQKYDRMEVSEWYQYLLSIEWSQDMIYGTRNTVDDFRVKADDFSKKSRYLPSASNPRAPTANILQAFVANLPAHTPPWKRNMAERFVEMVSYLSGAINTKVMNEGFATLMQELIPPHTQYSDFPHFAEYCCLMGGVTRKSLNNPYWLGLEAWRNIRKAFNARPENKGLKLLEQDRRFIEYATKEIIEKMDDKQFLRFGLTNTWLSRQNLVLTRKLPPKDWDPSLPPPRPGQYKQPIQHEIVTRDPSRLREAIIMNVKGFEFQMPRPVLTNLGTDGSGMIHLEISDRIGRELMLKTRSKVQTLLVMARMMQVPVSLESTEVRIMLATGGPVDPWLMKYWLQFMSVQELIENGHIKIVKTRNRTVVTPDGKVKGYEVFRNGDSSPAAIKLDQFERADDTGVEVKLVETENEKLQQFLDEYQEDLDLGSEALTTLNRQTTINRLDQAVSDMVNGVPTGLLVHVPTTPHALTEYYNFANMRKVEAIRRAIKRGRGLIHTKSGVAVKVFPDIPQLSFTKMSVQMFAGGVDTPVSSQLTKIVGKSLNRLQIGMTKMEKGADKLFTDLPLDIDEDGRSNPGKIWREGDQGDGDSEGEPGEDEDGEPGSTVGDVGNDPSYMEFDIDLYGTMLEDYIVLPNLRPLDGISRKSNMIRGGWAYKRNGAKQWGMIARKAIGRGKAYYAAKEIKETNPQKILQRGLILLEPKDIIVKSFTPDPVPDVNAVVFVKMDLSGSYLGFVDKTKQMLIDMRAMLLHKYKKVTFVYIAFDGSAIATDDIEEFVKMQLGGGTNYGSAFKKTIELFADYPAEKWDRFSVLAGDFEDFDMEPDMAGLVDEMRKGMRFTAGVRMNYRRDEGGATVEKLYRQFSEDDPYFSFVDLAPENDYTPLTLRQIFKNSESGEE